MYVPLLLELGDVEEERFPDEGEAGVNRYKSPRIRSAANDSVCCSGGRIALWWPCVDLLQNGLAQGLGDIVTGQIAIEGCRQLEGGSVLDGP